MITATPPSLQGRFSLVYTGDPALQPRPDDPTQHEKYDHDLKVARETGAWDAVSIPGAKLTVFSFEFPVGTARRRLSDRVRALFANGDHGTGAALLFRATLRSVDNWPGPKLQWVDEDGLRLVADDVVAYCDGHEALAPVINSLALEVWLRFQGALSGK